MSGSRRLERRTNEGPGSRHSGGGGSAMSEFVYLFRASLAGRRRTPRATSCSATPPISNDARARPHPLDLSEHLFRHESGRMVAALTRIFGVHNLTLASRTPSVARWRCG